MSAEDSASWSIEMPFWIDTDGYTDRDRQMFTAGAEFMQIYMWLKAGEPVNVCIMPENEDRCRMMAAKLGRKVVIESSGAGDWLTFRAED